ncbi:E3 ubiquitin-protein ligase TRIM33-like isoform X6 [Dreissena polymorpha]|uniref:E3 ubiquitin-protein ligase TRIM33-like isoform X6 n=1 Tax=Dreissena polymorpha TaxID=45954 RepID=UPI002264AFD8|nr:E3 ubiquitin-protein ligase TRIM33-like isoform X6 [Dreissena polymorpha]
MASYMESSIHRGSESFFDFSCFTCQENDRNTEADFYCEECSQFYCSKCVEHHNYLYKKHAILDKKNISQWPETDVSEQEICQVHKKEKLTGFCEDHSQLICHACHVHNHQLCSHVVLIADKVKDLHQNRDFEQLSATLDTQHQQLIKKKDDFEENLKSLEKSYKKILEEIDALRKTINDALDQLEKNTKKALDTLLVNVKTSIRNDIENCNKSIKNISCLQENLLTSKDKKEALSFIKYRKCLDQSLKVEASLQDMTANNERTLTFNPDRTIKQTLSALSGLGQILSTVKQSQPTKRTTQNTNTRQNTPKACSQSDPGNQTASRLKVNTSIPESSSSRHYSPGNQNSHLPKSGLVSDPVSSSSHQLVQGHQPGAVSKPDQIIKVKSSKKYSVKIERDRSKCYINGICETASGELLLTDRMNCRVKLLDRTYKVVAHCDLPGKPRSMCSIDSSLVAVTVHNEEVHFIRVTNDQLKEERILKLQHNCKGIAHHHGNLYITDGEALYNYTLDGRLVSKMYKDKSETSCAVSPDGDRIYVANISSNKLVTLSRDSTVISSLTVPDLSASIYGRPGLHVTDSGQVLVCGYYTHPVVQVDRDGRQILAEVVTKNNGVSLPLSVYYSKHTRSIIVGMYRNNDIIAFKEQ